MRRIDKTLSLATEYKEWYSKNEGATFKNRPYYYDVFFELLLIQKGLCAYTEIRLIDKNMLVEVAQNFRNGKYLDGFYPSVPADIEHFSKQQKKISAWDFDNLFVVFSKVNNEKNNLEDKYGLYDILKPDLAEYSPEKYLEYDQTEHIFIPLHSLDEESFNRVKNMILVLGLNNDWIKQRRRKHIKQIASAKEFLQDYDMDDEFITACNMYFK